MASTTARWHVHRASSMTLLLALVLPIVAANLLSAAASSAETLVARPRGVDIDVTTSAGGRDDDREGTAARVFFVTPSSATTTAAPASRPTTYSYDLELDHDPHDIEYLKKKFCPSCDSQMCANACDLPDCPHTNTTDCPNSSSCASTDNTTMLCPADREDNALDCPERRGQKDCQMNDDGPGSFTCVLPPSFDENFTILQPSADLSDNEGMLCNATQNVCCAHGTKCNFGPSITMDDGLLEECVPNGIPNQCCVETDDGEGSSTKAIGFIAAKIPESNGTVGVDVTAPGAGLEQLKNLACYCCEGTLAIQHVMDNMTITVDELKTATCQKKGFTGCNNATAGSIKVRAADDPETFAVCALCPFTAEAHCKNDQEACVFDVDCCDGLTCMTNMCMSAPPPTDGMDA